MAAVMDTEKGPDKGHKYKKDCRNIKERGLPRSFFEKRKLFRVYSVL